MTEAIRRILREDWDPISVGMTPDASGAYDRYVEGIYSLVVGRVGEDALAEYLWQIQTQRMGLARLGRARLNAVARRLQMLDSAWQ